METQIYNQFEFEKVSINNVLNIDLSVGFNFYLKNLSDEIVPLVYLHNRDTSSNEWIEFEKFIDREVIAKIIRDGGDIYELYTSRHECVMSFDCIDLSTAFDEHGMPLSTYSVVEYYRKMNSEQSIQ